MANVIKSVATIATVGLATYAGWGLYNKWGAAIAAGVSIIATWK